MSFRLIASLAVTACLGSASFANSLGLAGQFNAFIFGTATLNGGGESEGAIAVGGIGSAPGSTVFTANSNYNVLINNNPATVGTQTGVGLYVNGNAAFNNGGQLNNGGTADISGNFSTNNPFDLNGSGGALNYGGSLNGTVHGTTNHTNLVNASLFTAQQTYSQNQSNSIAALAANETVNMSNQNNWSLNLSGSHQTFVVDLTAAQLGGFNGNPVTLGLGSFNSTDTLIFNVSGTAVNNFGITVNSGGLQSNILWNFDNATSIDINNREFEGSLLAPKATVTQSNVIEGTLIADNWVTQNGPEIHSFNFNGNAPAPEPSSFLALGTGALGLMLFGRRRRKSVA